MLESKLKAFLFSHYSTSQGRTDIYIAFLEHAARNMAVNGIFSFIIPYPYTNQNYGTLSRKLIIEKYFIKEVVDTSEYRVFDNAVVKNIILNVVKQKQKAKTVITKVLSKEDFEKKKFKKFAIDQNAFLALKNYRIETKNISEALKVKEIIEKKSIKLEEIVLVAYGARLNHKSKKIGKEFYLSEEYEIGFKPYIEGKNIDRFYHSQKGWLNYQPKDHYNSMFPELFENEKIMFINVVSDRLRFTLDGEHLYNSHTVVNCVKWELLQKAEHSTVTRNISSKKILTSQEIDYNSLLAILNSNLINWYFKNFQSEGLHFYPDDAKNLPICMPTESENKKLATLVDNLIKYKTDDIERQDIEKEINDLIYKIYDLSEKEIKIVEDNFIVE